MAASSAISLGGVIKPRAREVCGGTKDQIVLKIPPVAIALPAATSIETDAVLSLQSCSAAAALVSGVMVCTMPLQTCCAVNRFCVTNVFISVSTAACVAASPAPESAP